ncbi:hypothetical protein PMAYCL1PPCAC_20756, partial [Pristionchus mayeri]
RLHTPKSSRSSQSSPDSRTSRCPRVGFGFINFTTKDDAARAFCSFGAHKSRFLRNKKIIIEYGRSESASVESERRFLA